MAMDPRHLMKYGSAERVTHRRTARGGHGLPKVSLGPANPYFYFPCRGGGGTPGVAHPTSGWPAVVFYPFGLPTPYAYGVTQSQLSASSRVTTEIQLLQSYEISLLFFVRKIKSLGTKLHATKAIRSFFLSLFIT
jgi:hypothetical protein